MKRRIQSAGVIAILLMLPLPLKSDSGQAATSKAPKKPVIALTIDYGDGAQKRFPEIPWRKAMTVFEALTWADKHPRGIDFDSRGKKQTLLITKIDDLKNGRSDEKNWVYRVNDKIADRSCAVFPTKAGDRILWRFEPYK